MFLFDVANLKPKTHILVVATYRAHTASSALEPFHIYIYIYGIVVYATNRELCALFWLAINVQGVVNIYSMCFWYKLTFVGWARRVYNSSIIQLISPERSSGILKPRSRSHSIYLVHVLRIFDGGPTHAANLCRMWCVYRWLNQEVLFFKYIWPHYHGKFKPQSEFWYITRRAFRDLSV